MPTRWGTAKTSRLTVTDNGGQVDSVTNAVAISLPLAVFIFSP